MMVERVAFISEHASPLALLGGVDAGGQNVYIDRVARQLAATGTYVDIFTRWDDPSKEKVIEYAPGVRVIHVKAGPITCLPKETLFPFMDEFAADMLAFIRESRLQYDLIHAHFWMSGYVATTLKEYLRIPFVVTFHALGKVRRLYQGTADAFPDIRFRVEEMVVRDADAVIAECPQDREDMLIHYFAKQKNIVVIPCGFDGEEFYPMNRSECARRIGVNPDEKIILQLGRMVPRKGVDTVVQATARLLKKHRVDARLLVVGGDSDEPDPAVTPEIGRLQELARDLGIASQVTFVGRRERDELKYFYNAADVFVSTPWYEPFGITILEAMACGTPVVGANVGGIKFSIEHGETGFLVPPKDPVILAKRLKELLENPRLARHFGKKALERVNAQFTWETVSRQIEALYDDVVTGEHGDKPRVHDGLRAPGTVRRYAELRSTTTPRSGG